MTTRIRRSRDRGHSDRGWLRAWHSFSFADYHDPEHMGFRVLRVLNEDVIAPGRGFGPHAHRDMEILTYMIQGHLRHRDSLGQERVLGVSEVQAMSAGTGVIHSEFNASDSEPSRSIQIWIEPAATDLAPAYQQVGFRREDMRGRLCLLAAPHGDGAPGGTRIHQDVRVYVVELDDDSLEMALEEGRHAWLQVVRGDIRCGDDTLSAGDGAAVSGETRLRMGGVGELLVFDLP
jgi:quercetin 2,3-dioxygenase